MKGLRYDIGKFRHLVTLHEVTRVDDGSGGFTRTDPSEATVLGQLWAEIEPVSSKEIRLGNKLEDQTTHRITVRWRNDIRQGQLIMYGSRQFYILTVTNPSEIRDFLELSCREGGPA